MERQAYLVSYVKTQHALKQQALEASRNFMELLTTALYTLAETLHAQDVPELEIAPDDQNQQALHLCFCERHVLIEPVDCAAEHSPTFKLLETTEPVAKINGFYLTGNLRNQAVVMEQIYITGAGHWIANGLSGYSHQGELVADDVAAYAFALLECIALKINTPHLGRDEALPLSSTGKAPLGFVLR